MERSICFTKFTIYKIHNIYIYIHIYYLYHRFPPWQCLWTIPYPSSPLPFFSTAIQAMHSVQRLQPRQQPCLTISGDMVMATSTEGAVPIQIKLLLFFLARNYVCMFMFFHRERERVAYTIWRCLKVGNPTTMGFNTKLVQPWMIWGILILGNLHIL
jgi:hypothetical protein